MRYFASKIAILAMYFAKSAQNWTSFPNPVTQYHREIWWIKEKTQKLKYRRNRPVFQSAPIKHDCQTWTIRIASLKHCFCDYISTKNACWACGGGGGGGGGDGSGWVGVGLGTHPEFADVRQAIPVVNLNSCKKIVVWHPPKFPRALRARFARADLLNLYYHLGSGMCPRLKKRFPKFSIGMGPIYTRKAITSRARWSFFHEIERYFAFLHRYIAT